MDVALKFIILLIKLPRRPICHDVVDSRQRHNDMIMAFDRIRLRKVVNTIKPSLKIKAVKQ